MQNGFYNNEVSNVRGQFDIQNAINQNSDSLQMSINQGVNGIQSTLNQGFNCTQNAMNQGFNGVQSALAQTNYNMKDCCCETRESIMQSNFNNQTSFNGIQNAMQQGFCGVQNGQENLKYALAQSTCDIISNADKNTDRIINHLVQSEMDALRNQLQSANFQLSQQAQTSNIINQLQPVARPAYLVQSPYMSAPLGGFGGNGTFNNNNSCGCC
jgi:phage-related protein